MFRQLDRIEIVTADAKGWLIGRPAASIDAFSLSNICELMSLEETALTFEEVVRTAGDGARLCSRNLIVPREVQGSLPRRSGFGRTVVGDFWSRIVHLFTWEFRRISSRCTKFPQEVKRVK